jgi:hypothetical protein
MASARWTLLAELHSDLAAHPSAAAARELIPDDPEPIPPFLPAEWLAAVRMHG